MATIALAFQRDQRTPRKKFSLPNLLHAGKRSAAGDTLRQWPKESISHPHRHHILAVKELSPPSNDLVPERRRSLIKRKPLGSHRASARERVGVSSSPDSSTSWLLSSDDDGQDPIANLKKAIKTCGTSPTITAPPRVSVKPLNRGHLLPIDSDRGNQANLRTQLHVCETATVVRMIRVQMPESLSTLVRRYSEGDSSSGSESTGPESLSLSETSSNGTTPSLHDVIAPAHPPLAPPSFNSSASITQAAICDTMAEDAPVHLQMPESQQQQAVESADVMHDLAASLLVGRQQGLEAQKKRRWGLVTRAKSKSKHWIGRVSETEVAA